MHAPRGASKPDEPALDLASQDLLQFLIIFFGHELKLNRQPLDVLDGVGGKRRPIRSAYLQQSCDMLSQFLYDRVTRIVIPMAGYRMTQTNRSRREARNFDVK